MKLFGEEYEVQIETDELLETRAVLELPAILHCGVYTTCWIDEVETNDEAEVKAVERLQTLVNWLDMKSQTRKDRG